LLRRQGSEGAGEVEDFDPVHTEVAEQFLLLFQRIEQTEFPGAVLENGPRVRPECDNEGLVSPLMREGDESLDDKTMAEMDPVEKAGGGDHRA